MAVSQACLEDGGEDDESVQNCNYSEIHGIQSVTNASLANNRGVRLILRELGMDRQRISRLQWTVSTLTAVASATADFPPCPSKIGI